MEADQKKKEWKEGLETPVQYLKGVGPQRAELLSRLDVETVEDLLTLLPRRYLNRSNFEVISNIQVGQSATVLGKIEDLGISQTRKGQDILVMMLKDDSGFIYCRWFNQPRIVK
jgi:ATP-dependent DNA helicase RecG